MSGPDETSSARPRIDTSVNLLTIGVVFAGAVIGWTANREAVRENAEDVASLSATVSTLNSEIKQLGSRVLTLENSFSFGRTKMADIDGNLQTLSRDFSGFLRQYAEDRRFFVPEERPSTAGDRDGR